MDPILTDLLAQARTMKARCSMSRRKLNQLQEGLLPYYHQHGYLSPVNLQAVIEITLILQELDGDEQ